MNMRVIGNSFADISLKLNENNRAIDLKHNLGKTLERVHTVPANVNFSESSSTKNSNDYFNMKSIKMFADNILDATKMAIGENSNTKIEQKLNDIQSSVSNRFLYDFDTEKVSKKDINFLADTKRKLVNLIKVRNLSTNNISSKDATELARKQFSSALNSVLNNKEWDSITKTVDISGKSFSSLLTPASQMKWPSGNDIFPVSYNNKGISSSSTTEINHCTNLWNSKFDVGDSDQKVTLFSGFRHGTLCPYGIEDANVRFNGAVNRGKEIITAALFMDKEKLNDALEGKIVTLHLASTSLETAINSNLANIKEKMQISTQIAAWEALSSEKLNLNIMDANNQPKTVTINVDVAAFNVGVNNLASGHFKIGNNWSSQVNNVAAEKLLGKLDNSEIGGWVKDFIANNKSEDNTQLLQTATKLKQFFQGENTLYTDQYEIAKDIAVVSYKTGTKPCWNCKSGKDRTGMLDTVIKDALVNEYNKTDSTQNQDTFNQVLLNSGNLDIQTFNTGIPGNKVLKRNIGLDLVLGKTGLREKIKDDEVIQLAKGGAKIA